MIKRLILIAASSCPKIHLGAWESCLPGNVVWNFDPGSIALSPGDYRSVHNLLQMEAAPAGERVEEIVQIGEPISRREDWLPRLAVGSGRPQRGTVTVAFFVDTFPDASTHSTVIV